MDSTLTAGSHLTDEMLERFDARAPVYDATNSFFHEDFEELRASGYLDVAIPQEFGGPGLSLAEVMRLQRRLAYHAPATAVAINMHLYWVGVAADLYRAGDTSCAWILEAAADGHVFAAGHGEAGNDVPLSLSTTKAERVEGGWTFTGHKIFGSLSPVWTYFGLHGMDTSDPERPVVVHGFLSRDAGGYEIRETWDVLGMRATTSHDTVLERAFVPDERIAVVSAAGAAGAGLFHLAINAWALIGFANVYQGIAQRAYDLATANVKKKSSIALTRSMAYHPEVQHHVAQMRMKLLTVEALIERTATEWSEGVDHGIDWAVRIVTAKHVAVTEAWKVVDTAFDLTGGGGIFKSNRMEQVFRDARLGRFHPANTLFAPEVVAKLSLGIDPDEQPRWG
ncbi:MAG TPA: acyl-CoA dehydrogenase family protein [Solirubrobacteraceae bacterium]|nr:acyl-CoA dehydrogenase family protein [Solirubrobacteraceae bacterium]